MMRLSLVALALCAAFAVAARPQEPPAKKTVEKVPIRQTSPASGEEMYVSYCAACHGKAGKGDGPAASALRQAPSDLTVLAKNNNGKFPSDHVVYVLRFGSALPAHGSKDMPVWGKLFESLHGRTTGSDALSQMRVSNLTKYLESLQVK